MIKVNLEGNEHNLKNVLAQNKLLSKDEQLLINE